MNCDVPRTSGHMDVLGVSKGDEDVLGVSKGDEDPRNRPKGVQNVSERVCKCSTGRSPEDSPKGGRNDRGSPSGEAHASGASGRIEDVGKRPRKLRNTSEHVRECSERKNKKKFTRGSSRQARGPGQRMTHDDSDRSHDQLSLVLRLVQDVKQ